MGAAAECLVKNPGSRGAMRERKNKEAAGSSVEPVQLTGKSLLRFRCHRDLACWNACCHGMGIMLAPYDILRLRRRLGMTSGEFLEQYTDSSIHEESGLPTVTLKMGGGGKRGCPFKSEAGCSVYEERPSTCRYYPVGLAALRTKKEEEKQACEERFYFLVREEHCLGHGGEEVWTVDDWREDQGVGRDDEINRDWQTAFLSRSLPQEESLSSRRQALFHMTCYDLDAFRRFVLESSFLDQFEVDPDTVERIRENDKDLLLFALRYMKFFMMIEQTMKPRKGVLENWQERQAD